MNRLAVFIFLFLALATTISGCSSRIVIGGFTDSPDKKYYVAGRVFGAYGHSFTNNTAKTVLISIFTNDDQKTLLFRKEYRVKGCDVGWHATWDEHNNLTMVIYDSGPSVQFNRSAKDEPPRRNILSLSYRLDSKAGVFTEDAK